MRARVERLARRVGDVFRFEDQGDSFDDYAFRAFPFFWSLTLIAILVFSNVPISLWVVSGTVANHVVGLYAGMLMVFAVAPLRFPRLHPWGAALAVAVMAGRAGGFFELAIDRSSWALTGAILERAAYALGMIMWHRSAVRRIAREHVAKAALHDTLG